MGYGPPLPQDILDELNELKRKVARLESNPRLLNASVTDPDTDATLLYVGKLQTGEHGVLVQRNDGTLALGVYGGSKGAVQFLAGFDRVQNIIFGDDTASGTGLARPWLPLPFANLDMSTASHTASGSFTDLELCAAFHSHPQVYVLALVQCDAGTAGEVRLRDNISGAAFGAAQAVGAGVTQYVTWDGLILGGLHMTQVSVSLQGRVTSGAGQIRARVVAAYARQT